MIAVPVSHVVVRKIERLHAPEQEDTRGCDLSAGKCYQHLQKCIGDEDCTRKANMIRGAKQTYRVVASIRNQNCPGVYLRRSVDAPSQAAPVLRTSVVTPLGAIVREILRTWTRIQVFRFRRGKPGSVAHRPVENDPQCVNKRNLGCSKGSDRSSKVQQELRSNPLEILNLW